MIQLPVREKAVLETLQKAPKENVVLVGGYAINAYVPPRFSIDCDLVVLGDSSKVEALLKGEGFVKAEKGDVPDGSYVRYEREKERVSFDLLIDVVLDRQSGVSFDTPLFEKHSKTRTTVGRVNPIRIEMRIADPELLFAMKFVAGRRQDVRDLFMLAGENLDWNVVTEILRERCKPEFIEKRVKTIRKGFEGENYRPSLQGAYGKMPDRKYEECKAKLAAFLDDLAGGAEWKEIFSRAEKKELKLTEADVEREVWAARKERKSRKG
ncbi:MAG: nucleotidyl transferase AbiEii/AbiGii toxin family protein [Methanobacteriota archaeon]